MSSHNQDNFQDVLQHILTLLQVDYNSDLDRSSLTAFNRLKTREKKTLLKGFLLNPPVEPPQQEEPSLEDILGNDTTTQEGLDIEAYNQKELIDLKTWIVKVIAIFILVIITLVIVASFIFSGTDGLAGSLFGEAGHQLKLFFLL